MSGVVVSGNTDIPSAMFGCDGFFDYNESFSTLLEQHQFSSDLMERLTALLDGNAPDSLKPPLLTAWRNFVLVVEPGAGECRISLPDFSEVMDSIRRPESEQIFFKMLEAMYDDCVIINKEGLLETVMPKERLNNSCICPVFPEYGQNFRKNDHF